MDTRIFISSKDKASKSFFKQKGLDELNSYLLDKAPPEVPISDLEKFYCVYPVNLEQAESEYGTKDVKVRIYELPIISTQFANTFEILHYNTDEVNQFINPDKTGGITPAFLCQPQIEEFFRIKGLNCRISMCKEF